MISEAILETIRTYNEYLEKLASCLSHLCDDLVESDYLFMSPVIPAGMDGLAWVDDAAYHFVLLKLLDIAIYDEFKESLTHLKSALDANNYVLYHELLTKKIIPSLTGLFIEQPVNAGVYEE